MEISIEGEILSVHSINKVLNKLDFNDSQKRVTLYCDATCEDVDIFFVAVLLLLNFEYKLHFTLDITQVPNDTQETLGRKIKRYLSQANDLYPIRADLIISIKSTNDNDYSGKKGKTAAENFLPIVYVNKETLPKYFGYVTDPNLERLRLEQLKILNAQLKITPEILEKFKLNPENLPIRISNFKRVSDDDKEKLQSYLRATTQVMSAVDQNPIIFLLILSTTLSIDTKLSGFRKKDIEDNTKKLYGVIQFVDEYTRGLNELAKNITEHSPSEKGIITMKAYSKLERQHMETHVLDLGDVGIIPTLLEHTKRLNNDHNNFFLEDEQIIESNDYKLINFIDPSPSRKLKQQIKRDVAHLGLLFFYKLLQKNGGALSLSSPGHKKRNLFGLQKANPTTTKGTHFHFDLPVKSNTFNPVANRIRNPGNQGTEEMIQSISNMLDFEIMNDPDHAEESKKEIIYNITLDYPIRDKASEAKFYKEFYKVYSKRKSHYLSVDVDDNITDSSILFRVLAFLATYDSARNHIFYNIQSSVYIDLLNLNNSYFDVFRSLDIPYWNETKATLIYTFIEMNNGKFNFADLLFGNTKSEHLAVNHLIDQSFRNVTSLVNQENPDIDIDSITPRLSPFFYQSTLLPFDIYFTQDDHPLYLNNLKIVLENKII